MKEEHFKLISIGLMLLIVVIVLASLAMANGITVSAPKSANPGTGVPVATSPVAGVNSPVLNG
jgi:predicted secreted protein